MDQITWPRIVTVMVSIGMLFVLITIGKLFETVGPDEITIIQSPVEGRLDVYVSQGLKWQGYGEVTTYKKRSTYAFDTERTGIVVRFNEGGHGTIFGSIQYELPLDRDKIVAFHSKYKTQETLQKELVETVTNKAIYLVGTLMSSRESYAEKRNDLIHYVSDQVQSGVYKTRQRTEWTKDQITGQDKSITVAEIIIGKDGKPERQEESVLSRFGVVAYNFTINRIPYDAVVEKQIKQQQEISMDIQTSIVDLKKAEQRALTVEQQGRADATKSKWDQEVIKAKAVTLAEQEKVVQITNAERDKIVAETAGAQRLAVAELDKRAAEQTKLQNILLGEGEAERKRLVLEADGALTQKLEAWSAAQTVYANAIKGSTWTPGVVIGGGQGAAANNNVVQDLLSMFMAKTAKDLSLDMSMRAMPQTQTPATPRR